MVDTDASTIIVRPRNYYGKDAFTSKPTPGLASRVLVSLAWTFMTIVNAVRPEINGDSSGLNVNLKAIDFLKFSVATTLLSIGLRKSKIWMVLLWIAITVHNLVYVQYPDSIRVYKQLQDNYYDELHRQLHWVAFGFYALAIGLRVSLLGRVLFLALKQWYHKKLAEMIREHYQT